MKYQQHIPGFVEGTPMKGELRTRAELEILPFIQEFFRMPNFHRLSVNFRTYGSPLLMGEVQGGKKWYVLAYLDGDDIESLGLPKWHEPARPKKESRKRER